MRTTCLLAHSSRPSLYFTTEQNTFWPMVSTVTSPPRKPAVLGSSVMLDKALRDAILHSFEANISHGLRPSIADRRKSVTAMLLDIEWQEWSDREIARKCGVSHTLVAAMRKELGAEKKETKYKLKGKETKRQEKPKQEEKPQEPSQAEIDKEEMTAAVHDLREKNEELQDQLTVALSASLDEIEKEKAQSVIRDLRSQIRLLEIELKAVTSSRDQFQAENAQLMKQVQMLQKKLKKLEGN